MRNLGFTAVFVLLSVMLGAETVMVAVGRSGPAGPAVEKDLQRLSAVEDGIMETFFLSDTIIFNDGSYPAPSERAALMRRAREGGADRLLLVEVRFAPQRDGEEEEKAPLPERLLYSYFDIKSLGEIQSGEILAQTFGQDEGESAEKYCARLGGEIARRILRVGGLFSSGRNGPEGRKSLIPVYVASDN